MDRVYVIIDALDESQNRVRLLSLLRLIATEERFSRIQLLATSRQYEDIRVQMCHISKSLSMTNPFVEADIRIFVNARVRSEQRFKNWPEDLCTEVLEALTVGAKGMFRWAACQLDILRRVHHRSKIREAIKTLPETLDETYERIFSYITATEERGLVRHALHMVCFHDFLWRGEGCLPSRLLLSSYSAFRNEEDVASPDDLLCDLATLRDVCGCLVTFSQRDNPGQNAKAEEETAIIAHYTVREFLESSRASGKLAEWIKFDSKRRYSTLLSSVFGFTLTSNTPPQQVPDSDKPPNPLIIRSTSSLREYCLASSIRSLFKCEELIEPNLAFRLLDPSAPHYEQVKSALEYGAQYDWYIDLLSGGSAWPLSWAEETKASHAVILVDLLVMGRYLLAEEFVSHLGQHADHVMQDVLGGKILGVSIWENYEKLSRTRFQGDVLNVLAQLDVLHLRNFNLIKRVVGGAIRNHDIILFFIATCGYDTDVNVDKSSSEDGDMVHELLRCGASHTPAGYQVTPIQLACCKRSLRGVRALLEAGADPNYVGDPHGIGWDDEDLLLHPFRKLHGTSPIDILVRYDAIFNYRDEVEEEEKYLVNGIVTDEIRRVLLEYGARPTLEYGHSQESGSDGERNYDNDLG